jgi:hypothetical protein
VAKDKYDELVKTMKEDPEIIGGYRQTIDMYYCGTVWPAK